MQVNLLKKSADKSDENDLGLQRSNRGIKMKREMLKSKIHRATITGKNIAYEGSVTIDKKLCAIADIREFEKVDIYNIYNGERFTTYVIFGEENSCKIEINGAAARRNEVGDKIIIASYGVFEDAELENYKPKIVLLGENNSSVKED